MPGRRVERLNEQFRRELTEILRGEARDPRVAAVTLTAVRVDPDLSFARVFVAPQAEESGNEQALEGLAAAMPFLRKELGARLHIRRIPEMRFEIDRTLAHANRIEQLLRQVAETPLSTPTPTPTSTSTDGDAGAGEHGSGGDATDPGAGSPAERERDD